MKKIGNVLWGIVFVVVGIILAGNALGLTHINIFFDGWWTMFIIIPSFIGIFKDKDKTGNIIAFFIGIALLLCCQDLINFDLIWKLMLPTILVVIGFSFIFKDTVNKKVNDEIKKLNKDNKDANEYCATFSGQDLKLDGEEFKGATLTAVFGGVKYDLTKAIINENQVINCSSIFGGIEIFLPEDIQIKVKSNSIFGGISDKKKHTEKESSKIVYINASCIFGGVDIK